MQEVALGPRTPGNQSRRFPPSEDLTGPPSATGASRQPPAPIIKIAYPEMLSFDIPISQWYKFRRSEKEMKAEHREKVQKILVKKYGKSHKLRIERGVNQVASFWREEDGSLQDFEDFCLKNFISSPELLETNFKRLETNFEVLNGHFNKMMASLKLPLHLDLGPLLPLDRLFGQYNPAAHLSEDLFKNKIAFFVLINFPHYSLQEKNSLGSKWKRKDWAYARMGDLFISRPDASTLQRVSEVMTDADAYVSEYNIFMGKLKDEKGRTYFPSDLKLISHWGLRDELKARYADPHGFSKQKMIYEVMLRIINQQVPKNIINNPRFFWNPFENRVYKNGRRITSAPEPNTRYWHFLEVFKAVKELDSYFPSFPTYILRKFELERELEEAIVEKLFTEFLLSPQRREVAKIISQRLGRKLEAFDIWFDGFKPRRNVKEEELDRLVAKRYPTISTFKADLKNILRKLGFSAGLRDFIAPQIEVEPARGAGHAWGAEMKSEKALLRTRVPKGGMNYKGFHIALHELGHCVEQTLTLQKVDFYSLHGVPNTAFTEAFAFIFQGKDLEILGLRERDKNSKSLRVLDRFWSTYEIMGVSLVDMKAWNWLYQNSGATPRELKEAVISIAKGIWNSYYADIFHIQDRPILAVYSHLINSALYLPDYPLGQIIAFQIEKYLEGKNLGEEMERMCRAGKLSPQLWMRKAVGSGISTQSLLKSLEEALKR